MIRFTNCPTCGSARLAVDGLGIQGCLACGKDTATNISAADGDRTMNKLAAHAAQTLPVGYVVSSDIWSALKAAADAPRSIDLVNQTIFSGVNIAVDPDVQAGHLEACYSPFSWHQRLRQIRKRA